MIFYKIDHFLEISDVITAQLVAFDYGLYKIGVAISDIDRRFAMPVQILYANCVSQQIDRMVDMIKKYSNKKRLFCILGLPLDQYGRDNKRTDKIKQIAKLLVKKDINVYLQNESFSSKIANHMMIQYNIKIPKNKNSKYQNDAIAAQVILEDFLEEYHCNKKVESDSILNMK